MPLTYFYAELFGVILIVMSLAMVMNKHAMLTTFNELAESRPIIFIAGLMSMFVGLIAVLTHNVWNGGALAFFVTLIGWAFLLKGIFCFFFPHGSYKKLMHAIKFEHVYYPYSFLALILGVFLSYYGFFGY